jgi:hypothetical protein
VSQPIDDQNTPETPIPPVLVWTVHAARADNVGHVEAVYSKAETACDHARARSEDLGVLAAAVTRFTVDVMGTRSGSALYVNGTRQAVPYVSDSRDRTS